MCLSRERERETDKKRMESIRFFYNVFFLLKIIIAFIIRIITIMISSLLLLILRDSDILIILTENVYIHEEMNYMSMEAVICNEH